VARVARRLLAVKPLTPGLREGITAMNPADTDGQLDEMIYRIAMLRCSLKLIAPNAAKQQWINDELTWCCNIATKIALQKTRELVDKHHQMAVR
jgi:hypothetical protein